MLKPLEQFICDECGQVINSPKEGYVEWESGIDKNGKMFARGFRIIHSSQASPMEKINGKGCFKYDESPYCSDIDLDYFQKTVHQKLFSLLDLGFMHDKNQEVGCQISDFREFVDFFKRLTIPYYEEARQYFQEAIEDCEISDENEIYLFTEENLKRIVQRYDKY